MDYGRILRRAWHITLHYRALWVFGILMALLSGSTSGSSGSNSNFSFNGGGLGRMPGVPFSPDGGFGAESAAAIFVVIALLVLLAFVFAIASVVLRYISETALIRMVDHTEDTGEKLRWTQGFRLGWSRRALRLFLIDLVVTIPLIIVFVLLFVMALLPLLAWVSNNDTLGIIGTVAAIGLVVLVIVLAIVVAVALSLLRPYFFRMAVLRDRGVFDSIGQGYALVRRRFTQAGSMWLIMVGIQIVYGIATLIVGLAVVLVGGGIATALGLGVYAAANAVLNTGWAVALGLLVGIPFFIVLVGIPLLFIGGLWEVYYSSVWTLTFRELAGPTLPTAVASTGVPPADTAATEVPPAEPPMAEGPGEAI